MKSDLQPSVAIRWNRALGTEFDKGMSVQASGSITQLPLPQQATLLPMVKRGSPVTMRKAREAIFVFPDRPLSVLQQRLFNSCVYFAQRQPEFHSWKVLISELEHVIGYKDSSNRRYVMGSYSAS